MPQSAVRGGGFRAPDGYRYELTGGHLALDLANTVDGRPTSQPRELLGSWEDLLDWSEQAKALDGESTRRLRREGALRPEEAAAVVRRVRFLREVLFRLFAAAAEREPFPAEDLAVLNDALPHALQRLRLVGSDGVLGWSWAHPAASLDQMVAPVVRAAAELLIDAERLSRVRVCEAGDVCRWLFLDLSRNRTRRWCDMAVCGNRAKARRHHARTALRAAARAARRR